MFALACFSNRANRHICAVNLLSDGSGVMTVEIRIFGWSRSVVGIFYERIQTGVNSDSRHALLGKPKAHICCFSCLPLSMWLFHQSAMMRCGMCLDMNNSHTGSTNGIGGTCDLIPSSTGTPFGRCQNHRCLSPTIQQEGNGSYKHGAACTLLSFFLSVYILCNMLSLCKCACAALSSKVALYLTLIMCVCVLSSQPQSH